MKTKKKEAGMALLKTYFSSKVVNGSRERFSSDRSSFGMLQRHNHNCCIMSDQIGQFLKVIGEKFAYKSSANISMIFWSILESNTFK